MNDFRALNTQELETVNGGVSTLPSPNSPFVRLTFWIAEKIADALK